MNDVRLLEPELSAAHCLELLGGHTWGVGLRATKEAFSRIRLESLAHGT